MATWYDMARDKSLTFVAPDRARAEALMLRPGLAAEIDEFLAAPYVLVVEPDAAATRVLDSAEDGSCYDPLSSWVVALCRKRGWSALSADPERLRRIDPSVEVHPL